MHGFELTCSAGIAAYPADAEEARPVPARGQSPVLGEALRKATDPPIRSRARESRLERSAGGEIDALLRPGGDRDGFQPVVALASGQLVGYEALSRFPSSPGAHRRAIRAGHGCGLGAALEAAAIRARWSRWDGRSTPIWPSTSALRPSARRLRGAPADLTGVVIEITEHEIVADDEIIAGAIATSSRGARIAIDDAGAATPDSSR